MFKLTISRGRDSLASARRAALCRRHTSRLRRGGVDDPKVVAERTDDPELVVEENLVQVVLEVLSVVIAVPGIAQPMRLAIAQHASRGGVRRRGITWQPRCPSKG